MLLRGFTDSDTHVLKVGQSEESEWRADIHNT